MLMMHDHENTDHQISEAAWQMCPSYILPKADGILQTTTQMKAFVGSMPFVLSPEMLLACLCGGMGSELSLYMVHIRSSFGQTRHLGRINICSISINVEE